MKTKKVAIFLTNGFEEIEAITPIDLLQRAGITVDIVSITEENLVESANDPSLANNSIDELSNTISTSSISSLYFLSSLP